MNERVNGGGRGGASLMNERNVLRERRRARPGWGANGNAGRTRALALRVAAARLHEGECRARERSGAGRAWSVRGPRAASSLSGRTALPGSGGDNEGGGDGRRAAGKAP